MRCVRPIICLFATVLLTLAGLGSHVLALVPGVVPAVSTTSESLPGHETSSQEDAVHSRQSVFAPVVAAQREPQPTSNRPTSTAGARTPHQPTRPLFLVNCRFTC